MEREKPLWFYKVKAVVLALILVSQIFYIRNMRRCDKAEAETRAGQRADERGDYDGAIAHFKNAERILGQ